MHSTVTFLYFVFFLAVGMWAVLRPATSVHWTRTAQLEIGPGKFPAAAVRGIGAMFILVAVLMLLAELLQLR